ncbi:glycosyl hydrolase family 61-domain-containing protein [Mycena rebaudengoi]|nr:glycosyl hydrolase family 61-domain-containing protein [Mycena rebaudengoi]
MKSASLVVAVSHFFAAVSAHYVWPQLIVGGSNTTAWQYVRQTNNWQQLTPLESVTSPDIRCYTSTQSGTAPGVMSVAAGSTVGFTVNGNPSTLYHPGTVNVYMAKAPTGTDVSKWDGSGNVWFKIYQIPAITDGGTTITFPATDLDHVSFPIPAATPSGQYLIRIEHIAVHSASYFGGAQFYIACAQVQASGTGTPGPLVAFPGAYTLKYPYRVNIYYPIPTTWVQPGPAVWAGGSGSVTTTPGTTITTTRTTTSTPSTPTGPTAPQFGQCGGQGWTGATVCVAPFTCKVVNNFYSQCL